MSGTHEPRPWPGWPRALVIAALSTGAVIVTFVGGAVGYFVTILPLNVLLDVSGWEIPSALSAVGLPFALAYRTRRVWWLYHLLAGVTVGQCLLLFTLMALWTG